MVDRLADNWIEDFGIVPQNNPSFFTDPSELSPNTPQAHVLRQAFSLLDIDGILCSDNVPLIYFKQLETIDIEGVVKLHRQFWNHGGAPILILISSEEVHIYSGLVRPEPYSSNLKSPSPLISVLKRVADEMRPLLLSIKSGEFFQQNARSFETGQRVDRVLLQNLGDTREILRKETTNADTFDLLDALLCRLVFTCYLFDRGVINERYLADLGIENCSHLREVLAVKPVGHAKRALYDLFAQLGADFNGDLFSSDLITEAEYISEQHLTVLCDFFQGTQVRTGQWSFWPYDFGFIPIETISAIYEHFLKEENQNDGAFYTPRFLAELTLDTALEGHESLLDRTFLDPACGSGIFLVGLFNRMAEEWTQANPNARYDRRSKELMRLLCNQLKGVDKDPTACRIAAFSLYLAYLDQLAPSDIQALQAKGRALPNLVSCPDPSIDDLVDQSRAIIRCADFFELHEDEPTKVDLVIGNPPWASIAGKDTPAGMWCSENRRTLPDKQIATAFVWKAAEHVSETGRICLILPHGILFNHGTKAIEFQKSWVSCHSIERVLNLTDLRRFLFNEAIHPAIVVRYSKNAPDGSTEKIEYWSPKANWMATHAEIVPVMPQDRVNLSLSAILDNLNSEDAPQIWKKAFWASQRDQRLLDRLLLYPRLADRVQRPKDKKANKNKPWQMAEGFQPIGQNDNPDKAKTIELPSRRFIEATSKSIDLFVLPNDTDKLDGNKIELRQKSNTNTHVFKAPHVLITKGFRRIAYADFDVSFRHALRGIHGPMEDRRLLIFVAAFLRSSLAQYLGFHISSNWGVYRPELHVEEVLRLPFPLPEHLDDEKRAWQIIDAVVQRVEESITATKKNFLKRDFIIEEANSQIDALIEEYFDIHPLEKVLIDDTLNVIIPSIQPTLSQMPVATIRPSTSAQQSAYTIGVCEILNRWSKQSGQAVRGTAHGSSTLGIGVVILEKVDAAQLDQPMETPHSEIVSILKRIQEAIPRQQQSIDPIRGVMVFDNNRLYLTKPIGQLYWTQTAALNDADLIAGTILMQRSLEPA